MYAACGRYYLGSPHITIEVHARFVYKGRIASGELGHLYIFTPILGRRTRKIGRRGDPVLYGLQELTSQKVKPVIKRHITGHYRISE